MKNISTDRWYSYCICTTATINSNKNICIQQRLGPATMNITVQIEIMIMISHDKKQNDQFHAQRVKCWKQYTIGKEHQFKLLLLKKSITKKYDKIHITIPNAHLQKKKEHSGKSKHNELNKNSRKSVFWSAAQHGDDDLWYYRINFLSFGIDMGNKTANFFQQ